MSSKVRAVGVIFQNEEGKILVLRRNPQDPEGNTWGLVGGKPDPGETSQEAAIREVKEEIGHEINPADLKFLKTYHWDRDDLDLTFDVFKLKIPKSEVMINLAKNENTEHRWVLPQELFRQPDLMQGLYPILEDEYLLN